MNYRSRLHFGLLFWSPVLSLAVLKEDVACGRSCESGHGKSSCLLQAAVQERTARMNVTNSFEHAGLLEAGKAITNTDSIRWGVAAVFVLVGCWSITKETLANAAEQGNKKRDSLWDVARAVLMLFVINYHFQSYDNYCMDVDDNWYIGFAMPAFFLISGLFSRRRGGNYWTNLLVNNVMNACIFAPFYAMRYSPCVGSLWFLWGLAAYRAILQPLLSGCEQVLGRSAGTCAGLMLSVCFDAVLKHIYLPSSCCKSDGLECRPCLPIVQIDQEQLNRISFHGIFFVVGFAIDAASLRHMLQQKITVVLAFMYLISLAWILTKHDDWFVDKMENPFQENPPIMFASNAFQNLSFWTFTVTQRTLAALCFIACLIPLADAENSCLRFLCRMFTASGTRSLYVYCLHFAFIERFKLIDLQDTVDEHARMYLPYPLSFCPHQLMQVLIMLSLSSPLVERLFHFIVSPQWIVDTVSGNLSGVSHKVEK